VELRQPTLGGRRRDPVPLLHLPVRALPGFMALRDERQPVRDGR
jgi:hypothetical protein